MLLRLSGPGLLPLGETSQVPFVGRICERTDVSAEERAKEILRITHGTAGFPLGFRAYLFDDPHNGQVQRDSYALGADWRYLSAGDIIRVDPSRRSLNVLYRRTSPSNSFLVTERCDNFCLMCSQPPKPHDDGWLVDELMEVVPLVSPDTHEIGITGGEPALLGERLVRLIEHMKVHLPRTAIHVLSNGRRFADPTFARSIAAVRHPDLMIGIPLYSDLPEEHDYVVQASGAYEDTIRGILNLKTAGVRVELRFVIHAETFERLPTFARFVARNLLFVDHVALMGLELTGFAKVNIDTLWIDPLDYREQLAAAVRTLARAGLHVSIYNHQLCVLPSELHTFARKSISDWKNAYFDECALCIARVACGGFFASSTIRRSRGLSRII